jgi:RNA polymerase sigma factor (TIGR02999 family)
MAIMSDVTVLLEAIRAGSSGAADQLADAVYGQLRQLAATKLARESRDHPWQPTELLHEAWLRLGDAARFDNRAHFFGAAAEAMRRVLIDDARRRHAVRHGGACKRVEWEAAAEVAHNPADELLAVHEALDSLERIDATAATLVKLRYFGGFTLSQAADALGLPERTAERRWGYARAWLYDALSPSGPAPAKKNPPRSGGDDRGTAHEKAE